MKNKLLTMNLTHAGWETPLGRIEAAADAEGLYFIRFAAGRSGAAVRIGSAAAGGSGAAESRAAKAEQGGKIGISSIGESAAESGMANSVSMAARTGSALKNGTAAEDPAAGNISAAAEDASGAAILAALKAQLDAYFRGESAEFNLPLHFAGHSAFRQAAWAAMRRVPAGQTRSYAEQAEMMGRPRSFCRAAAAANGANPFVIIVPCHRIIAASGGLGGYSSGLERKRALLAHESRFWGAGARLI